jgi:hypothetical protein
MAAAGGCASARNVLPPPTQAELYLLKS